jgi:hypothetical protein
MVLEGMDLLKVRIRWMCHQMMRFSSSATVLGLVSKNGILVAGRGGRAASAYDLVEFCKQPKGLISKDDLGFGRSIGFMGRRASLLEPH